MTVARDFLAGPGYAMKHCARHGALDFIRLVLAGRLGPRVGVVYATPDRCPVCTAMKAQAAVPS